MHRGAKFFHFFSSKVRLVVPLAAGMPIVYINHPIMLPSRLKCETPPVTPHPDLGCRLSNFPNFTLEEISKHNTKSSVWVTYKQGVYDITDFVSKHPGGDKIMLGAGGSVEPFWRLYGQHLHLPHVSYMMEDMRIGNIDPIDWEKKENELASSPSIDDPYRVDKSIKRHPGLAFITREPANAESPISLLVDSFLTPNELFFVRHHFPVPLASREAIKFSPGSREITIDHLRTGYVHHSVISTIQCTGNRRTGCAHPWIPRAQTGRFRARALTGCPSWRNSHHD